MYKGQLEGFPTEIVEKMLYYQVEQGNKRDVTMFESKRCADKYSGGFQWEDTPERYDFWYNIITNKNFDLFFSHYPKQQQTTIKMNVKQIIKDNDIEEVYSAVHGCNITKLKLDPFHDSGSWVYGGECLIFPSKEERNWDRFKPKEPNYKPCESVEQFADLFLGAKVKLKEGIGFKIVSIIEDENDLNYWFDNYTLIDGTPLGIKCENA